MTNTIRMKVRVGGLTKDDPPLLAYSKIVARPDGKRKLFSQMAAVTDAELLARLRRDVHPGDEAEVVVEQRLCDTGISIVLKDFCVVGARAATLAG